MKVSKCVKGLALMLFMAAGIISGANSIAIGQKERGEKREGGENRGRGEGRRGGDEGRGEGRRGDDEYRGRGEGRRGGDENRGEGRRGNDEGRGRGDNGGGWRRQMGGWPQPQVQTQPERQVWRRQVPQEYFKDRGSDSRRGDNRGDHNEGRRSSARDTWSGWESPQRSAEREDRGRNADRKMFREQQKAYRRYERDDRPDGQQNWFGRGAQAYRQQYGRESGNYETNMYNRYDRRPRAYTRSYDQYRNSGPVASAAARRFFSYAAPLYSSRDGYSPNRYDQYQNGYDGPFYDAGQYGSNIGTSWKQQLIRTLISSVLGGALNQGGNNNYVQQYDPYYPAGPVSYAYSQPAYSGGGYSPYYGSYAPQYAGYNTGYLPYSGYEQQPYDGDLNYGDGLLNSLPIAELFGRSGGGNFVTQMLTGVLTQGYLQGLLAGDYARDNGYGADAYNDPYVSDDGVYDPYSYSIGENRRLMSEGYDLGFDDALQGRNQYDPQAVGNVDLVSLLLGNVFSLS